MFFGEVYGGTEIAQLEVFHKLVIDREAAGRAAEFAGIIPVEKSANLPPLRGTRHDGVAYLEQGRRLGMPQARGGEAAAGLEMEIEPGRVNVFIAMGKSHGDVRFIGALVGGKSRVAVDAKHGAARRTRIGDEVRRNFV